MKGGYFNRFRGRQLSFIPIALILTTIFLWAWEKSPLVSTLLSAQEQFVMPSSEILISAHNNPSVSISQKEYNEKDILHSFVTEKASKKKMDQGFDKEQMKKDISPLFITEETSKGQKESGLDVEPLRSTVTSTTERKADGRDSMPLSSETKVCNYAKGRWVADTNRPLYSGFGCKRWLSEMWACRLTQRMDFSYEGFRWQPENCKMPEFEGAAFLERMQDKTVAFIGDSLGRQQFQSLMCMISGGAESPEVEDVGREYGLVKARGAIRPDGWAYRFPSTNTTVLYYWSATLCNLEPLNMKNPSTEYAMHLDRPAAFLRQYLHRFNVLVLNTGHHWNGGKLRANRWVMHVNGMLSEDKKLAEIGNAKNFTVHSVAKWLDSQLPLHPQLKAFFRTISPRHFVNGDWNTGGSCDNTIPLAGGSEVWQDGSNDPVIEGAVKGTKVKILDITAISQLRDEGHISRYTIRPTEGMQDCLHWCLPGIPDTWNELLYAQL